MGNKLTIISVAALAIALTGCNRESSNLSASAGSQRSGSAAPDTAGCEPLETGQEVLRPGNHGF